MDCKIITVCLFSVLQLRGLDAGSSLQLPCYNSTGRDVNLPLDSIIHFSDVVLLGRIVAVEDGEFGTYTAVVSYYYSYKSDGLLPQTFFSSTSVANFILAPQRGQLGFFFTHREPTMQLTSFCITPVGEMTGNSVGYQEIVDHINEVGSNDTKWNSERVISYPSPCDSQSCGLGSYCNEVNTLPGAVTRCSCMTGFREADNTGAGFCQASEIGAASLYCSECSHNARCLPTLNLDPSSPRCSCGHINCEGVLRKSLCGSDGRDYPGECQMMLEACQQQKRIHKLYEGRCRTHVAQPCMGYGEPLSTFAGLVRCTVSDANSCPAQYFCHSPAPTPYYSVCCPVLHSPTGPTTPPAKPTTHPPATPTTHPTTGRCRSAGSGDFGSGSSSNMAGSGDSDAEDDNC